MHDHTGSLIFSATNIMNNQPEQVNKIAALVELESDDEVDSKTLSGNDKDKADQDSGMNTKTSPQHGAAKNHKEHTKTHSKCPKTPSPCQLYHDIMSSPPQAARPTREVLNDTTLFAQIPFPILPRQGQEESPQGSYVFRKRARTICGRSSPHSISDSGATKRARLAFQ